MSGNGTDLGHVLAMLQGVLQGQEAARGEIHSLRGEMHSLRGEMLSMGAELRGEIAALRGDHGRKLDDLAGQVSTLRQTVTEYHASVLGHGTLISELDARMSRVEQHLGLPRLA